MPCIFSSILLLDANAETSGAAKTGTTRRKLGKDEERRFHDSGVFILFSVIDL